MRLESKILVEDVPEQAGQINIHIADTQCRASALREVLAKQRLSMRNIVRITGIGELIVDDYRPGEWAEVIEIRPKLSLKFVANESADMEVWFPALRICHEATFNTLMSVPLLRYVEKDLTINKTHLPALELVGGTLSSGESHSMPLSSLVAVGGYVFGARQTPELRFVGEQYFVHAQGLAHSDLVTRLGADAMALGAAYLAQRRACIVATQDAVMDIEEDDASGCQADMNL